MECGGFASTFVIVDITGYYGEGLTAGLFERWRSSIRRASRGCVSGMAAKAVLVIFGRVEYQFGSSARCTLSSVRLVVAAINETMVA